MLDEFEDMIEYDVTVDEQEEEVLVETAPKKLPTRSKKDAAVKKARPRHECFCGQSFATRVRLTNHMKVKHTEIAEEDLLACLTCGKKFKLQSYLELHIRNIHTDNPPKYRQPVSCSICGKILKSTEALKNHEEMHSLAFAPEDVAKKFSCDMCGMRFRLKGYIFNHINNVHLRSKYSCEFCGKGFYKRYEVNEHIVRFHTMERPIVCEYDGCGKTFARQKNYSIHKVKFLIKIDFF